MRITVDEVWAKGWAPLVVFDANGLLIERYVGWFDPETGEVQVSVFERDGSFAINGSEVMKTVEKYAAPLIWKSVKCVNFTERWKRPYRDEVCQER